jgi:hypothetical protein
MPLQAYFIGLWQGGASKRIIQFSYWASSHVVWCGGRPGRSFEQPEIKFLRLISISIIYFHRLLLPRPHCLRYQLLS